MMEAVLYDDNSVHNNYFLTAGMNNQLKRKLTLDLNFGPSEDGKTISGNMAQMSVIKKAKVASLETPCSAAILSSPDLYKLNLASPELEKFIIQQASTLPTPNPTQSQIFFPKNVTEEQEAYVQGFQEALTKLQQNPPTAGAPGQIMTSNNNNLVMGNNFIINTSTSLHTLTNVNQLTQEQIIQFNNQRLAQQHQQQLVIQQQQKQQAPPPAYYDNDTSSSDDSVSENSCSNSTSSSITYSTGHMIIPTSVPVLNSSHAAFPVAVTSASNGNNNNSIISHRLPDYQINQLATTGSSGNIAAIPTTAAGYTLSSSPHTILVKEEPQTVPNVSSPAPVSPIDMESQERIKLERKRQRNRLAASKCRKRKLERISKLEDKVKQLKGENVDLTTVLTKLKETVCSLKQQVMDHVNSGCQIIISPNLTSTF